MPRENKTKRQSAELRHRPAMRVAAGARARVSRSGDDTQRVIHELEVHQGELEMQNAELRRASVALEATYDELYDFAPVGYFTLGSYGNIARTNLTGAAMLGVARGLLLGQRFARFVAPDSRPNFNAFLRRVAHGGDEKESCLLTLLKQGNTPVTAYMEASGVGRAPACRAVVVDITSAEQARLDLRESEARLSMVLAAANMGLWEWERKTGDIYWSPECFRIFGVDRFCPTLGSLVPMLHPEDAARIKSIVSQMLIDGKEKTVEFRIIRPNGEITWIRSHGKPLCNDVGKPLRLLGLVQDIGERKQVDRNTSAGRIA